MKENFQINSKEIDKVFEVAEIVMKRRGCILTDLDKEILVYVNDISKEYRSSF